MLDKSAGVVLADLSKEMLMEAKGKGEFMRVCSHTEGFPFPDKRFSCILMVDAMHHVCDQPDTANELWRVLKPGGMIGVNESTVRPQTPQNLIETFLKHPATYGTFTPKSLKQLFESAGFENIKIQEFWNIDTPSPMMGLGCRGLLNFLIQVYPRIVLKLLRDKRFREASRIDNQITKGGKEYMGYVLVVGQNPKDKGGIRNGYE